MCNRLATPEERELFEYTKRNNMVLHETQKFYHANAFSRPYLPVQLSGLSGHLGGAFWGLIPDFIQGEKEADAFYRKFHTYNAVSERIFQTNSLKNYIGTNRALLFVKGFYEPHKVNSRTSLPYYISMQSEPFFTLGCVFSIIHLDDGQRRATISIITTAANDLLRRVHNEKERMPLVIAPEDREKWLSQLEPEEIAAMMVTFPDGKLQAWQVSRDLYKSAIDTDYPNILANVGGEIWT